MWKRRKKTVICKSLEELYEWLQTGSDVEANWGERTCVFYVGPGNANVSIDRASNYHPHETWEELIADPVFDGKTLEEILPELDVK